MQQNVSMNGDSLFGFLLVEVVARADIIKVIYDMSVDLLYLLARDDLSVLNLIVVLFYVVRRLHLLANKKGTCYSALVVKPVSLLAIPRILHK